MSQGGKKMDPQTQAVWLKYQEGVRKSRQYQEEQRRKQALKNAPKAVEVNIKAPQPQNKQPAQRFTQEQTNKILSELDIHRPPRTWTSVVTDENIVPFYSMMNELSEKLSRPIWQRFTAQPLKVNPYSLTFDQLIEKNRAIVQTRKGTLLFNDLVSRFYLQSLPSQFKQKYSKHMQTNQKIFTGYIGWSIFGLIYIKLNKRKEYTWVNRINHIWIKSLGIITTGLLGMNYYLGVRDSEFARENVNIVETCVDTQLRILETHGEDLDETLKRFVEVGKKGG